MTREPASAIHKVAEDSRLWRGLLTLTQAWAVAWDRSSLGRVVATSTARVRQATPAGRLRAGASIAAWACAWHLAGLVVLPRYVISALPLAWFIAAGIVALLAAFAAEAFVRAWETSALRRLLSRFATS